MKVKTLFVFVLMIALVCASVPVFAEATRANPNIAQASILLTTSMKATFVCSTRAEYTISVTSVKLEVKNSNGTWSSAGSLPAPASVSNASAYTKEMDYSGYCTKGNTYRITATFNAGGESVSRTSAEKTYN